MKDKVSYCSFGGCLVEVDVEDYVSKSPVKIEEKLDYAISLAKCLLIGHIKSNPDSIGWIANELNLPGAWMPEGPKFKDGSSDAT